MKLPECHSPRSIVCLLAIFLLFALITTVSVGMSVAADVQGVSTAPASVVGTGPQFVNPPPIPLVLDPVEVYHLVPRQVLPAVIRPQAATITVNYLTTGSSVFGYPCSPWDANAQTAFSYAVGIWAGYLNASIPIVIDACWSNMGSTSLLGTGGSSYYNISGTYYPTALANELSGSDLNGTSAEIQTVFNSANTTWNYATNGVPLSGKLDFVSVVLHEVCHGLGFSGTMKVDDGVNDPLNPYDTECRDIAGEGCWGWGSNIPAAYDRFTMDNLGHGLINTVYFGNPSTALGNQLKSGNVFFSGTNAVAANGGTNVELYAPATWTAGSSYSHLDDAVFNGTANALMTHAISTNEADHDPGPVTLGLLKDIGWSIVTPDTTPPPAPISLAATPASWTNSNVFSINWTNPSDPSGIGTPYYYKIGSAPTSNADGSSTSSKPFNVAATAQGGQLIYVWLQDGVGNKSYLNNSSTTLYYDGTAPTDGALTATPGNGSASLSWTASSDTGGSGLASANRYMLRRNTGGYPACNGGTQVYLGNGTSSPDSGLANGTTYYYRVCAYDNAGNASNGATATATLPVFVQFAASPSGRTVIVDGSTRTTPWTTPVPWAPGSSHPVNVASPQAGAANTQYVFSSWSDGGAQSHSVAPVVDTTYTANFTTQYSLTTSVSVGNGSIQPATGTWYNSGSSAQLTAFPAAGYVVSGWNVDCSGAGTDLATTLTMNGPKICSVNFATCGSNPAKLTGGSTYPSIGAAYTAAADGGTIQLIATTITASPDFNRTSPEISITLQGGYGCNFSTGPSSVSIISGSVTVSKGKLTADGIVIM